MMTENFQPDSEVAITEVISQILKDISHTMSGSPASGANRFDARYKEYQAEARALSLMIKAEADLRQRHENQAEATKNENYIAYEDLPPLSPEGLEKLEKRFAHLAYKTEIKGQLPALPRPT